MKILTMLLSLSLTRAREQSSLLAQIDKSDPEYDSSSFSTNKGFKAFFKEFKKYEEALKNIPGGPSRANDLRKSVNAALLSTPAGGGQG